MPPLRIVVSGTHASGKSTLISDFRLALPEYTLQHDPFDDIDDRDDPASASSFLTQFAVTVRRSSEGRPGTSVIAERGPLDFLAYLRALDALGRWSLSDELEERLLGWAAAAMRVTDLLIVLPREDRILIPADEDAPLRIAMDDQLRECLDDPDLLGDTAAVHEISGERRQRLAALLQAVELRTRGR